MPTAHCPLPAAFVLLFPGKLQSWFNSRPFSSRSPNLLFPFLTSKNGHSEAASPLCPHRVFLFSSLQNCLFPKEAAWQFPSPSGFKHPRRPPSWLLPWYMHAWFTLWYWFMSAPKGLRSGYKLIGLSTLGYPKAVGECLIHTLSMLGVLWSLCSGSASTKDG